MPLWLTNVQPVCLTAHLAKRWIALPPPVRRSKNDCPDIHDNMYYCGSAGSTAKNVCGAGFAESGSKTLPMPADGGIALAKAALGVF